MLRFEGAIRFHADIGRLRGIELRQLHADPVQMQARDLFIQMLGQDVDVVLVVLAVLPKLDLRQHLVGEARRHHEGRVAGGIAEALITTAAGLCVAIPTLVGHRIIKDKAQSLIFEMEESSIKIVDILEGYAIQKT